MLELLKVIVQPVVLERGAGGEIVGERVGSSHPLYTPAQVEQFFSTVHEKLEQLNAPEPVED